MNWRKSSFSSGGATNCVEVASSPGTVLVRDTTDREGAKLRITREDFNRFISAIKQDTL